MAKRGIKKGIKFANKLVIDASEKAVIATAIKLFGGIVDDTPVDTGRLRGNWQARIGSPETKIIEKEDKGGVATKANISSVASRYQLDKSLWLSNNLPYANVIESGNNKIVGHFMVKRAVASFKQEMDRQTRKNKVK